LRRVSSGPSEGSSAHASAECPSGLDGEELADWRAGRNAVYQLAALTVGARLADA
jgi:hypothetical protein